MKSVACLFLACLVVFAAAETGLKLTITPKAIAAFKDDFLPKVVAKVQNLTIPSIEAGALTVTNFNLINLALPSEGLSVRFGTNKIYLSSMNFGVHAVLHIYYQIWGYLALSTTIDCATSDSSIAFTVSTTSDNKFSVNEFHVKINNLNIYFPDSYIGFLYHGLIYVFTWPIQSILNSVISSQVKTALQATLNEAMSDAPHFITIPNSQIGVDYELSSVPKITRDYMTVYVNGTFYNAASNFTVPPVPAPRAFPEFDSISGQHFQLFVSEYVFNTALFEVYSQGMMDIVVTNDMMPQEAPIRFGTKWLKSFIPNINTYFNESNNVTMHFKAASNPIVSMTPTDMKVNLDTQLSFTYYAGDNVTEIVKIQGSLEVHANVTLANWTMKPNIINATFTSMNVLNSNVGNITGDKFKQGFNVLFLFALGGFNAQFKPISLPKVPGVNLETSTVTFEDGHMRIQSTPVYEEAVVVLPQTPVSEVNQTENPSLRGAQF